LHLTVLGLLVACSGKDSETTTLGDTSPACATDEFVGDPEAAPTIEPIIVLPDASWVALSDGDSVDLHTPLQGGKVILAGALVSNVALDCGRLRVGALLRDPTDPDERVVKNEERHVRYAEMADRPGWAEPVVINDERNMAPNLEACGFTSYPRDVAGCAWIVEVRIEDSATEEVLASERRSVTPTCPTDDPGDPGVSEELEQALCECQCAAAYEAGRCDAADLPTWVAPDPVCE
jgi:hypothetical protein